MTGILRRAGRFGRTIRHLRAGQLVAQGWNRMRRAVERPERWDPGPVPPRPEWRESEVGELPAPTPPLDPAEILAGRLHFAGEEREAGWPPEWSRQDASALWQYNLHYHDWLWTLVRGGEWDSGVAAAADWIAHHPLAGGAVGWDPYPISLRLQNWVLLLFRGNGARLVESGRADLFWSSLWKQARRLEERLEWHLLGNHLLENAITLTLLGVTFDGGEAARWRARGTRVLREQLAEQILPDGMHFELSPMYHLRVTWLLAMLAGLGDAGVAALVRDPLERASEALERLRHPDGGIALLNDSGLGIYSEGVGCATAARGAWSLREAGYYGWRSKDGDYLVCDAGRIGPDYLPGHAHADCLSFELSVGGRRVITDTGVSGYRASEQRSWDRSTAAHNTVEINGRDQAEMWGAFRVGARGYPKEVRWEPRNDGLLLEAAHSGYERLEAGVTHWRRFELCGRRLRIVDRVRGRGRYVAVGRLHLAPGCMIEDGAKISWNGGAGRVGIVGGGTLTIGESPCHARFGERVLRAMLVYRVEVEREAEWETTLEWE